MDDNGDRQEQGLDVTFFLRPNGHQVVQRIANVREEDAAWLRENNVAVSMEDLGSYGGFVVYFDYGKRVDDDDDTPDEHVELSGNRSCEETIARGVRAVKILRAAWLGQV